MGCRERCRSRFRPATFYRGERGSEIRRRVPHADFGPRTSPGRLENRHPPPRLVDRGAKEAREDRDLAPCAMRSFASKGRHFAEAEDDLRTCWERDRDRIVHSTAFRRLMYKTQVFINRE